MSFCIAQPKGAKSPKLYKFKKGDRILGVIPDNESFSNPEPVVIKPSEVIVHLGDEPPYGTAYGVLVEPVERRILLKGYGEFFSYIHDMPEQVEQRLFKALPAARSRVSKMGPPLDWDLVTEVRNPRGKLAGQYRYKSNGTDKLLMFPQQGQNARQMLKVAAHELGHGVWFRYMDATDRSRWIKLYEKYVQVREVPAKDIRLMVKDMRQIASLRDYMKDAEPEEQAAANIYLTWLKKVHQISKYEVQDLLESGDEIPTPDTHLHRSETQTPVTLYSKSSASELFCEALSSYVVDDLADSRMTKMLEDLK